MAFRIILQKLDRKILENYFKNLDEFGNFPDIKKKQN